MPEVDVGRFTVGVFQDVTSADHGIGALKRKGFPPESLSIVVKEAPETKALAERALGAGATTSVEVAGLGALVAGGTLVDALQGTARDLARIGLAAAFARVGFQAHDGRIFEALTQRGGVLVAVRSEPRAADALSTLHSYGGGNAAIGAWTGRL
jgi:hypothetical protein